MQAPPWRGRSHHLQLLEAAEPYRQCSCKIPRLLQLSACRAGRVVPARWGFATHAHAIAGPWITGRVVKQPVMAQNKIQDSFGSRLITKPCLRRTSFPLRQPPALSECVLITDSSLNLCERKSLVLSPRRKSSAVCTHAVIFPSWARTRSTTKPGYPMCLEWSQIGH